MKNIQIYDMTVEDYEKIKNHLILEFDSFWTPEILKSEIDEKNRIYIVAKENGNIVGFAGMLINNKEAEIMNIVTKVSQRDRGIGNLLLDKIIEISKKNSIEKIFLEVNENNHIALKLYEKVGFQKIAIRKKYYNNKEDAIIMSKKINNL